MKYRLGPIGQVVRARVSDAEWEPTVSKGEYSPSGSELGRRIELAWVEQGNLPYGKAAVIPKQAQRGGGEAKHTIEELSEDRFALLKSFIADPANWTDLPTDQELEVAEAEEEATAGANVAGLEMLVRRFLAKNLGLIEDGLRPHPDFPDIEEYITDVGRLDLFCQDRTGAPVIVELKAKELTDQALGQIVRYLAWAKDAYSNAPRVRGILLSPFPASKSVKAAATIIPGLEIKRYIISCSVE
jgi:RecB family endonuclease NucS